MFIKNEDGFVLPFMAILLPIFMLIGTLIVDGGNLYIRHDQIRFLAQEGANSGILTLGNMLENKAKNNFNTICSVEFPPAKCSSSNIFDFLNNTDIQNIILNISNQNLIKSSGKKFISDFDPQNNLTNSHIEIIFPHEYFVGNSVKILVKIKTIVPGFLEKIIPETREISVEVKSFLALQ